VTFTERSNPHRKTISLVRGPDDPGLVTLSSQGREATAVFIFKRSGNGLSLRRSLFDVKGEEAHWRFGKEKGETRRYSAGPDGDRRPVSSSRTKYSRVRGTVTEWPFQRTRGEEKMSMRGGRLGIKGSLGGECFTRYLKQRL